MKKEKVFVDIVKVYLYNEATYSNWEWSYQELVYDMVSEFDLNYDDIDYILTGFTRSEANQLFEKYLIIELEKIIGLETIATDDLNKKISDSLKVDVASINLNDWKEI